MADAWAGGTSGNAPWTARQWRAKASKRQVYRAFLGGRAGRRDEWM
jgi:hypothetical protein